jgi:hypothetical protein
MDNAQELNSTVFGSVGITRGYGLNGRGSVPGRSNKFFSSWQRPRRLWGPTSLLSMGAVGCLPGGKAAWCLINEAQGQLYLYVMFDEKRHLWSFLVGLRKLSPSFFFIFSLRSKYSVQYPVRERPQSIDFPQGVKTKFYTHTKQQTKL